MKPVETPPAIMKKPSGCMLLQASKTGVQAYVRETQPNLAQYPRPCVIDMRLPSWDMSPITVVVFMLNVAKRQQFTYQYWINAASMPGVRLLSKLSSERQMTVHFVTDHVERTLRTSNVVKHQARELLHKLSSKRSTCTEAELVEAQKRINTLYPTTWRMWQAMQHDGRG